MLATEVLPHRTNALLGKEWSILIFFKMFDLVAQKNNCATKQCWAIINVEIRQMKII
jgi:hypothetical protein